MQISMFSSEELPASPSASQDSEKDWMIRVATSCLPILPLLQSIGPDSWFGRTSPVSCHQTEGGILAPSSEGWQNSGMGSPTAFLTLSTCEQTDTLTQYPKDGGVCSLSDVLETGDVPQRYFLTPKACAGILRRAEKRGKQLPVLLHQALAAIANNLEPCEPMEEILGGGSENLVCAVAFSDCGATLKGGSGARGYPDPSDGNGHNIVCMAHGQGGAEITEGYAPTLNCNHEQPIAFSIQDGDKQAGGNLSPPLRSQEVGSTAVGVFQQSSMKGKGTIGYETSGVSKPCKTQVDGQMLHQGMQVRRLIPLECERLQGFPDNYTNIPSASDSARYKALGNSMAVNVMQLLGKRIQMVSEI